jgi:hypothetical protein
LPPRATNPAGPAQAACKPRLSADLITDGHGRRPSRAESRRQRLGLIGWQGFQPTAPAEIQVTKFNYYIADQTERANLSERVEKVSVTLPKLNEKRLATVSEVLPASMPSLSWPLAVNAILSYLVAYYND